MKCKNCNSLIDEGATTCPGCGKNVEELAAAGLIEKTEVPVAESQRETATKTQAEPSVDSGSTEQFTVESSNEIKPEKTADEQLETFSVESEPVKKKSKMPILLCSLLVLIIAIGGVLVWRYMKNYPKIVFETFIKNTMDYAKQNLTKPNYDTMSTTFDIKFDIKLKDDDTLGPIVDILNKFGLSGKVQVDAKKNISLINLNTTYSKSELLKADIFYKNNKINILLKDLYKKYITLDAEGLETTQEDESIDPEDLQYLINTTLTTINGSLKNEYFTRTFEGDLSKITLVLTEKVYADMITELLTKIKDDDKYLTILSELTITEKNEIKKSIDESLKDITTSNSEKEIAKISLFTKKNSKDVIKVEIEDLEDKITVSVEKESNEKYILSVTENGITSKLTIETSKVDDKDKVKVSSSINEDEFNFEITTSVKYNEPITEPNVSNSVNYLELTEEDMTQIYNNFLKKKGAQKIVADITDLMLLFGLTSSASEDTSIPTYVE